MTATENYDTTNMTTADVEALTDEAEGTAETAMADAYEQAKDTIDATIAAVDTGHQAPTPFNFLNERSITIATYDGTGHDTIGTIVEQIDKQVDIPVKLVTLRSPEEAEKVQFNRLLLLGGGDIHPSYYGEEKTHSAVGNEPSTRDKTEIILSQRAIAAGLPQLGICRGHQMITVAHGGKLWQDFSKETNRFHGYKHGLRNVKDALGNHLATNQVNSFHHQAVRIMPTGFDVQATAWDGIVESIYKPGVMGVQFHPELMVNDNETWLNLFLWFILDGCM